MNFNETWALLWSQKQDAMHTELFSKTLESNCAACFNDTPGDYRILAVGSRDKIDSAAKRLSHLREKAKAWRGVCT